MHQYCISILSALILFIALPSQASLLHIIDFDGNNEGVQESLNFQSGDITLNISAWTANINSAQQQISPWTQLVGDYGVYKGSSGLGVVSNDIDGSDLDGGSSANLFDLDEGLLFQFSEAVNFWGFAAGSLTSNDDVNLALVHFIAPGEIELVDIFIDRDSGNRQDIFDINPFYGSAFMVWVDGNDDDVRVIDTAFIQVSEPTNLAILGLILLFISRRLRKQNF